MHSLEPWLKGLLAACIGGAANAGTIVLVDPEHFNLQEGIRSLLKVAIVGAVVSVLGYLKKSPLPGVHPHPTEDRHGGGYASKPAAAP